MEKIKIKNLRSLVNTEDIEIKPLTVLVGKNSTGKSTLLRFFPLMKQTLMTRRNEPILWYGKDYVDFGSFKESISKNKTSDFIEFEFNFDLEVDHWKKNKVKTLLKVEINESEFNKISVLLGKFKIEISSIGNKFYDLKINGENQGTTLLNFKSEFNSSFIPQFAFLPIKDENSSDEGQKRQVYNSKQFYTEIFKRKYKKFSTSEIEEFLGLLKSLDIEDYVFIKRSFIKRILNEITFENDFFEEEEEGEFEEKKFVKYLNDVSDNEFIDLCKLLIGYELDALFEKINAYCKNYFSGVHYIAPVRASAQRYYRLQGLAVDEIDSQGENIPMVLKHLSAQQKKGFEEWVLENFDFRISTEMKGGHVNLTISFDGKNKLNLADTGFGYSQILPIIVLLWRISTRMEEENNSNNHNFRFFLNPVIPYTIVIEQPELHLHPAMQAQLTDVFAKCILVAKKMKYELKIIIETHSETIINRLGQLVSRDKIDSDSVNILIFGESQGHVNTTIKSVEYDEEGVIEDWPIGFFYPNL